MGFDCQGLGIRPFAPISSSGGVGYATVRGKIVTSSPTGGIASHARPSVPRGKPYSEDLSNDSPPCLGGLNPREAKFILFLVDTSEDLRLDCRFVEPRRESGPRNRFFAAVPETFRGPLLNVGRPRIFILIACLVSDLDWRDQWPP